MDLQYINSGGASLSFLGGEGGSVTLVEPSGKNGKFESVGMVLLASAFQRTDFTVQDICGACFFVEASAGVAWGDAGYAMSFGINPALLAAYPVLPDKAMQWIEKSVKGHLLFRGTNYGLLAGGSLGGFVGYMRAMYWAHGSVARVARDAKLDSRSAAWGEARDSVRTSVNAFHAFFERTDEHCRN
jgi:hypothetical protein